MKCNLEQSSKLTLYNYNILIFRALVAGLQLSCLGVINTHYKLGGNFVYAIESYHSLQLHTKLATVLPAVCFHRLSAAGIVMCSQWMRE